MFSLLMRPPCHIFLALFVMFATNFLSSSASTDTLYIRLQKQKVCSTATCKKTAFSILQNMDQSVNPCDDFYQFACGNFTKNAIIEDGRSKNEIFFRIRDLVQIQLKNSIEDGITESDPQAFKLLQSYYKTCVNEDLVEKNSENEFLEILKNLGGWPVLAGDSWDESSFDWKQTMYRFREIGYSFGQFINFRISTDMKNNTRHILFLDQAALGIAQEYLSQGLEQEVVKAYFKYMVNFAEIFGADREQAEKELEESLNFEIELAKISLPSSERRDMTKLYNLMTIEDLQKNYPYLSWLDYFNKILSPYAYVESHEKVNVAVPSFFEKLSALLERTPARVQANYAFWRLAKDSAAMLSDRVRKAQRDFSASMTGNSIKTPKWQECVDHVSGRLHLAAGALFVRRYFHKSTKDSALEMVQNIRESFQKMLTEIDWMDKNTKTAALEKLANIVPLIAYPDELLDNEKLDEYYKGLKVYPESLIKTMLSYSLYGIAKEFEKFRMPVIRLDWSGRYGAAAVVNAFYNPSANTIQLPAGILQEALFNAKNPKYVNYASIGSFVGHEFTHEFDDLGSLFDKQGNLVDWWDPKTKAEYLNRAQCIINQYSNYTVKEVGLKVNGQLTQGENIADNGGIKEAYFAYAAYERKNGAEPRLPGLESFTPKQTFWIANAHVWCAKYRPEYLKNQILTDEHTPNEYRVNGPISNMPEFSEDFKCPLGSTMNPAKKCTVW